MSDIIEKRQTAFIEGRHMLHNVLIANEAVEEAKRSNKSYMVFKVDCEKVYDSVSWDFLKYLLTAVLNQLLSLYWSMGAQKVNSFPKKGLDKGIH